MHLQIRINVQRRRQFVQIAALGILLIVHQHHAGQVHFGSHAGVSCRLRHIGGVQWFGDFIIQPLLQLRVIGVLTDFSADHVFLCLIDPAIGLGRRYQCT
ncbi:hypothetical protein D3C85_1648490 [compost metagenome]